MTRGRRNKERGADRRLRPHLLRNERNEFRLDGERRVKFGKELQRLNPDATVFKDWWVIYSAALQLAIRQGTYAA